MKNQVICYTFKQNYYLMTGDIGKGAMGSLVWGLVPQKCIVKKVQCILFSNYQDEFQWGFWLLKSME